MKTFIGIDNGRGSVGIITIGKTTVRTKYFPVPCKSEQNYTKKKANISRVVNQTLTTLLTGYDPKNTFVLIERPMINPMRFSQSIIAGRALEAVLVVIENLGYKHAYCDSKEWQRMLLPQRSLAKKGKQTGKGSAKKSRPIASSRKIQEISQNGFFRNFPRKSKDRKTAMGS